MEFTYIRDLTHNYMVTRPEGNTEDFVLRMALTQNIDGLIPVEGRMINDELYLYYRTDSLLSLENRSLVQRPRHKDLKELFHALLRVERDLADYLIGPDNLCLTPETVFTDPSDGSWHFTCMPFSQHSGTLASFSEALLSLLDPEDGDAIADAYRICERTQEGNVRLRDLVHLLTEGKEEEEDTEYHMPREGGGSRMKKREKERTAESRAEERRREAILDEVWPPGGRAEEETEEKEKGKALVRPGILCILFAVTFLADMYIRKNYVLTGAGNILSLAVAAVCLAGAVGAFVYGIRKREREEDISDAGWTNARAYELWEDTYEREDAYEREEEELSYEEEDCVPVYEAEEEEEGTVLLSAARNRRTPKLYGRNSVNNCNISLDRLPVTLGKLAGRVDLQLRDKSVSRIHAHINKNADGRVIVKDLNSTNGTYHNGIRLKPNESVCIREGDEICFGNMVFEYL